ncbi:hypothetical protein BHE74_00028481 [Ensete ventricosum]|nr:hypothetical protein GW17_00059850 [Ensete ventricosum]RWW64292.1 hypothetical protein BHE74_00028481 [Ensete ventricosum]
MALSSSRSAPSSLEPVSPTPSSSPPRKEPFGGTRTTTSIEPPSMAPSSFVPGAERATPSRTPSRNSSSCSVVIDSDRLWWRRRRLPPALLTVLFCSVDCCVAGEWWNRGANAVLEEALSTGGEVNSSDAFTINGQPGDLYPCSSAGVDLMLVEHGKTYLLRVVNAAMSNGLFFSVASHTVVVVGSDGNYVKPLSADYIMITPGETMDLLLEANRPPDALYYMAGRAFSYLSLGSFPTTATTAIVEYVSDLPLESTKPLLPTLPYYNDTAAATNFSFALRSPANAGHPVDVPKTVDQDMFIVVAINELECPQASCAGPNGTRLRASLNNISFVDPPIDILEAYYAGIGGVFGENFPSMPPYYYNFTATDQPLSLLLPTLGTEVRVLEYGARMEVVFQGTTLVMGDNHPMHLHGYSFYVVGWGYGNFDKERDPLRYNLEDPPFKNTIGVPVNGWVAVRFTVNNPGEFPTPHPPMASHRRRRQPNHISLIIPEACL